MINQAEFNESLERHNMGKDEPFFTSSLFWDCECENDYIHEKSIELACSICGANDEDMPDAHADEILILLPNLPLVKSWEGR